jgi:beta-lactamase class A
MVTDTNGTNFSFQTNDSNYFYPASSVKFPIALLALKKANQIAEIDSKTSFQIEGDSIKTTIQKEVQKIFAVSDNEAYNRLFEFLGQDEINNRLRAKDLGKTHIRHLLSTDNPTNLNTKGISFFKNDSIVYAQEAKSNQALQSLQLNTIQKGIKFYREDSLVSQPIDFSKKNYPPISTLHELMKRVQFPEKDIKNNRFQLSKNDQHFY